MYYIISLWLIMCEVLSLQKCSKPKKHFNLILIFAAKNPFELFIQVNLGLKNIYMRVYKTSLTPKEYIMYKKKIPFHRNKINI